MNFGGCLDRGASFLKTIRIKIASIQTRAQMIRKNKQEHKEPKRQDDSEPPVCSGRVLVQNAGFREQGQG
jgi:hypothetical protein